MRYEISWWQLTMMFVCINLSILVSYAPFLGGALPPSRDAWLAALASPIPALLLSFIAFALVRRFQGQNLFAFTRTILGRFFGAVVNGGMVVYFLHWCTVLVREFALFMDSVVYLRTPDVVFVVIFLILAIVGASQQVEFVARTAELSGFFIIIGTIFLLVSNIPQIDLGMLRPILGEGWRPVLQQTLVPVGIKAEAVWVVLLAGPYLNKMSDGPKAIGLGLGVNTLFSTATSAVLIAMFGPELISILAFVPLSAARLIQIGDVLERLEWILLLFWFGAMGVKVSLLLLGAQQGISSFLPRRWPPGAGLLAAALLVFVWSFVMLPTLTDILMFFRPEMLLPRIAPLQLLPLLLLPIAWLRKQPPSDDGRKQATSP